MITIHMAAKKGYEIIQAELRRDPDTCPFMVLISDGRANVSMNGKSPIQETKTIASMFRGRRHTVCGH